MLEFFVHSLSLLWGGRFLLPLFFVYAGFPPVYFFYTVGFLVPYVLLFIIYSLFLVIKKNGQQLNNEYIWTSFCN